MPRKKAKPPAHGGAREGAGRPAIDPADKRSHPITVRFTAAEYARLERAAAAAEITVKDLVILRALGG
jgi:hypothetical protein